MTTPSQSGDRWQRLWDLFHQAAERTPAERGTYLEAACGSDVELRREVGELLAADAASHSPLDRPAVAGPVADAVRSKDLSATGVHAFAPGEVLVDRFEIVRVLGRGGMGTVYEATDRELGTAVALKTLRPGLAADWQARQRFRHEINLARQVTHPNVCRLFDIVRHVETREGHDSETLILSMELLRGETLAERLQQQVRMDPCKTLPIVEQIAAGLDAAHRAGIVHRDLKPANVMLVPDGADVRAVITDYGLARTLAAEDSSLRQTRAGQLLGTPAYMAPEQLEDGPITAATDVYALGVLLYEMLTGTLPFRGKSAISAAVQKLRRPAPSPRGLLPDLDRRWESVMLRCLERDPVNRFQSATEVVEALASDDRVDVPRPAPAGRRRLVWIGVAAAFLAALAVLVGPRLLPPAAPASVPAGGESEAAAKVWTLITRFDNRTGEPVFDGALEYALERELSQSRVVTVVPQERVGDVLGLMERPPDTPIDAALGREIALRDGEIGAVVRGRVEKLSSTYILSVDVLEPDGGGSLASLSEEASSQDEVYLAVRRLAVSLRESLGESRSRIRAGETELARVTTPSLSALQLFTQADRAFRAGRFGLVVVFLRQAIVEDPEFASAYIYLAHAGELLGWPREKVLQFSEKAYQLSEGTPTRERLFIQGSWHAFRDEWQNAVASYRALVRLHPDHFWGVDRLVNILVTRLHLTSEAAEHRARRSDLQPGSVRAAITAAQALLTWTNDPAAARPYVDRGLELLESRSSAAEEAGADGRAWLKTYGFHERWMKGDLDGAWAVFSQVTESIGEKSGSTWIEAGAAITLGRLAVARELIETQPSDFEDFETLVFATLSEDDEKLAQFREVRYENGYNTPWEILRLVQLAHSDFGEANRRLAFAEIARMASNEQFVDDRTEIVRGMLTLNEGRIEEAITHLQPAVRQARTKGSFYYFLGSLSLARALELQGDLVSATAALEDARQQKGRVYQRFFNTGALWLRVVSRLVDLYRAMGEEAMAAEREAELRAHLRFADADHPLLLRLASSASS